MAVVTIVDGMTVAPVYVVWDNPRKRAARSE